MRPSRASRILAFVMYWWLRPLVVLFARPRFVVRLRGIIERTSAPPAKGTVVVDGPDGEWVRGPGVLESTESAILYLHGSGYVVCSPRTHRELVARLSRAAGVPAYVVDYRLAPEDPFPAAFDDCLEAYRSLLDAGYTRIVVAGDSAGGHLAISLAAALTRVTSSEGRSLRGPEGETSSPVPAGLVLFSPLVDPSFETAAATSREARDPMFTAGAARRMLSLYTEPADATDARLAVLDGEPGLMPPVLLHAGSREMLAADARALHAWLRAADVDVRTTIWRGQVHVFQLFGFLPEARQAVAEAGAFIRARLTAVEPAAL